MTKYLCGYVIRFSTEEEEEEEEEEEGFDFYLILCVLYFLFFASICWFDFVTVIIYSVDLLKNMPSCH